jgi:energy-coupling factor transport system substrate-specific component
MSENEKKKISLKDWTTRDLLVSAVIALVFALLLAGANYLLVLVTPLGPLAVQALSGLWVIPGICTAYILRRPGAAFSNQLLIGIIQVPLTPYGWMTVVGQLTYGIATEIVFAVTRYRNFGTAVLLIAGALTTLFNLGISFGPLGYLNLQVGEQIAVIVITLLSGALCGWVAKVLADAIAKTGVLNSFAIGQEHQQEI